MAHVRVPLLLAASVLVTAPASAQVIVAHRGASADAPENTLAAFQLAWQQGSDGIEGDFYLTADKQIVCIHDADTKRTAGKKRLVESCTLQELRQLEYGSWKDGKFAGEPIPTLAEVFATVPDGKLFVIELKSKQQIVPPLVEELKRLDTGRIRLMIISFDEPTVVACKTQLPQIKTHWLTGFKKQPNGPPREPTAGEIAATVRRTGADGVGMNGLPEVIDEKFVQQLRQGGCPEFHVWTIDSPEDAAYFQRLGAIGITTNVPAKIRKAVAVP